MEDKALEAGLHLREVFPGFEFTLINTFIASIIWIKVHIEHEVWNAEGLAIWNIRHLFWILVVPVFIHSIPFPFCTSLGIKNFLIQCCNLASEYLN